MSEFRRDAMTGDWVLVAPGRSARPHAPESQHARPIEQPAHIPSCPFCSGNEAMLPDIIEQRDHSKPPGWCLRIVPNKFAVVGNGAALATPGADSGITRPGVGRHEVVIESPRHNADLHTVNAAEASMIVGAWRSRVSALAARPEIESIVVFRNRGTGSGASLEHPHSQIIALPSVPPRLVRIAGWAAEHSSSARPCGVCQYLSDETREGSRIVEAGPSFVTLVPYAASAPFEQRIVPRRHQAAFSAIDDADLTGLGTAIQRAIARLALLRKDLSYRLAIDSWDAQFSDAPYLHWSVRIVPDIVTPGGFELGSGLPVNPKNPEQDAGLLRDLGLGES